MSGTALPCFAGSGIKEGEISLREGGKGFLLIRESNIYLVILIIQDSGFYPEITAIPSPAGVPSPPGRHFPYMDEKPDLGNCRFYDFSARKYQMYLMFRLSVILLLLLSGAGAGIVSASLQDSEGLPVPVIDAANISGDLPDSAFVISAGEGTPTVGVSPLNPAFVRYLQEPAGQATGAGIQTHGLGDIPSPVSYPELADAGITGPFVLELNDTYDLRDAGKVSPVRDQNGWGTCWAFATYGSLESSLLPAMNLTFSPKNLINRQGLDGNENSGGGISRSMAYLTRWDGPVNETDDPYPVGNWTQSLAFPPAAHVQQVIEYPPRTNRTDTDSIKAGLLTWGAAYVSIYWSDDYYNSPTSAYYMPENANKTSTGGGHGVTLIGWNNTFPASAFHETPPGDGAWIVKNSWGPAWGEEGYFYVSYYDKYIGSALDSQDVYRSTAFFTGEPVDNYQEAYLHDPLGSCRQYYINTPKTGTMAARYMAKEAGELSAIGFYTTDVLTNYTAVIYRNAAEGVKGDEVARFAGNLTHIGYHTIPVQAENPVILDEGELFAVALYLENQEHHYPLSWEEPIAGYSSNATAAEGETYYAPSIEGPYYDITSLLSNSSACLKAYTNPVPEPTPTPTPTLMASFTAKPVTGKSPLKVRFTDTSEGIPNRWIWNFGDGTKSLSQNPTKTYMRPGSYTVTLVVWNGTLSDEHTKPNFILVKNIDELAPDMEPVSP